MDQDLYSFNHYRDYLLVRVGPKNERKGIKSRLAAALRCQPSMLSQVLGGNLDLSLEQGAAVNTFFVHNNEESKYFLLLLLHARAGSPELKNHFQSQLEDLQQRSVILSERIGKKNELTAEQKSKYYSSWHYAAIHIATSIPHLQNREALSKYFRLPKMKINSIVEFLEDMGLLRNQKGRLVPGSVETFIGSDSDLILKHHCNWRMQAIDSFDRENSRDLHYSAVVSLAKEDVLKIKTQIMNVIQESLKIIRDSNEEELYSLGMDFFSLNKNTPDF